MKMLSKAVKILQVGIKVGSRFKISKRKNSNEIKTHQFTSETQKFTGQNQKQCCNLLWWRLVKNEKSFFINKIKGRMNVADDPFLPLNISLKQSKAIIGTKLLHSPLRSSEWGTYTHMYINNCWAVRCINWRAASRAAIKCRKISRRGPRLWWST